jgi:hypothetical protein
MTEEEKPDLQLRVYMDGVEMEDQALGIRLFMEQSKRQVEPEAELDPEMWYTPSVQYGAKFYELGNIHWVPEDAEKGRNPMFRVVREFQEHLKLEVKCQEIYMEEFERGVLLEHTRKAEFRRQRLQTALHALDEYYDGTVCDKVPETPAA